MNKRLFCIGLAIFIGLSSFSLVEDPLSVLLKKLEEFAKRYPQEKVHLHLDRPYYAIGDDIWFKAYVVDSRSNGPSTVSNVLYVELINEQNLLVQQAVLPVRDGISWGDFRLGEGLTDGNYRIRAYTQWMRNAGPDFFFDKMIKVANSAPDRIVARAAYQKGDHPQSIISFSDQDGKALAGTAVSYQLVQENGSSSIGKATTDSEGKIGIPILAGNSGMARVVATLTLSNKQKLTKVVPIRTAAARVDVQFFPEGGSLVEDLPSRIGIKAVNAEGRGEDVSGTIVDGDGTEVTSFATGYLGMGSFSLNPMSGKRYRAKVQFRDGSSREVELPVAQPSGYVLNINNTDSSKLQLRVLRSSGLLEKGELQLVGQQNGNVCLVSKVAAKVLVNLSVPKQSLPAGVVTFTLFTAEGVPVAERIAFVHNGSMRSEVELAGLKPVYGKREEMKLGLTASGMDAKGSFSVAVTNESIISADVDNESNILTSMLLSSELKGYIERPNHYFLDNSSKTRTELDQLMLTQGWRRLDWTALQQDQQPLFPFEAQQSLKISGTLTDRKGVAVVDGKVSIFSATNGVFSNAVQADAKGNFVFEEMDFNDSTKFNLQGSNAKKEKNLKLKLNIVPDQVITANRNMGDFEPDINTALKGYLDNAESYFEDLGKRGLLNRTIMLKQIEIKKEIPKKYVPEYSSNFNGPGNADAILTAEELSTSVTLAQAMAKVMGVTVSGGKAHVRLLGGSMAIVLDGMMLNTRNLDQINIMDVETVEVLSRSHNLVVYGVQGGTGVLVITTKRGPDKRRPTIISDPDSKISYMPKGYQISREFYVPKHATESDPRPDLRPLVYWNPNLVMGADGKVPINFSNSDQIGTYRIVVEGMDDKGNLARSVFKYQVN